MNLWRLLRSPYEVEQEFFTAFEQKFKILSCAIRAGEKSLAQSSIDPLAVEKA